MNRLVDTAQLRCRLLSRKFTEKEIDEYEHSYNKGIDAAIEIIDKMPAADIREMHSEWIEKNGIFECKECGYSFEHEGYVHFFNYCPCCGYKIGR